MMKAVRVHPKHANVPSGIVFYESSSSSFSLCYFLNIMYSKESLSHYLVDLPHVLVSCIMFATAPWAVGALSVVFFAYLAGNCFHHGLRKYPGPFLGSVTNWWRFFDVLARRPDITQLALHRRYGDIVRLGPNTLSFGSPAALRDIYGLKKGFVKVSDTYFDSSSDL